MIKLNLPKPVAKKAILNGLLGSSALFIFYYLVLLLVTKDPSHPFTQLKLYQPWMTILIFGFGLQISLYSLLKNNVQVILNPGEQSEAKIMAGSSAAVSGISMAACCAHHLADLIPILGIYGAALFLTEYQKELLILGVIANTLGLLFMTWMLFGKQKPKLIFNYIFLKNR